MKKLTAEHPFFEFMGTLGDWMILNVLFVVTSLPVITIGASLTSLYQVSLRRIRRESQYAAREYFNAFRKEWKESTKLWLFFLCTGIVLMFDVTYGQNLPGAVNIGIGCMAVLWCFVFAYAFPLQARFQNSMKNTLWNACILALRNLPVTVVIIGLGSIPAVCIAMGPFTVMAVMPIFLVIGFSLIIWLNSLLLTVIFEKIEEENTEKIGADFENQR